MKGLDIDVNEKPEEKFYQIKVTKNHLIGLCCILFFAGIIIFSWHYFQKAQHLQQSVEILNDKYSSLEQHTQELQQHNDALAVWLQEQSKKKEVTLQPVAAQQQCNSPYHLINNICCVDGNRNNVCDDQEIQYEQSRQQYLSYPSSDTAQEYPLPPPPQEYPTTSYAQEYTLDTSSYQNTPTYASSSNQPSEYVTEEDVQTIFQNSPFSGKLPEETRAIIGFWLPDGSRKYFSIVGNTLQEGQIGKYDAKITTSWEYIDALKQDFCGGIRTIMRNGNYEKEVEIGLIAATMKYSSIFSEAKGCAGA